MGAGGSAHARALPLFLFRFPKSDRSFATFSPGWHIPPRTEQTGCFKHDFTSKHRAKRRFDKAGRTNCPRPRHPERFLSRGRSENDLVAAIIIFCVSPSAPFPPTRADKIIDDKMMNSLTMHAYAAFPLWDFAVWTTP
jgi:hypothetical protein